MTGRAKAFVIFFMYKYMVSMESTTSDCGRKVHQQDNFWLSDAKQKFAVGRYGLLGKHWHIIAMFLHLV